MLERPLRQSCQLLTKTTGRRWRGQQGPDDRKAKPRPPVVSCRLAHQLLLPCGLLGRWKGSYARPDRRSRCIFCGSLPSITDRAQPDPLAVTPAASALQAPGRRSVRCRQARPAGVPEARRHRLRLGRAPAAAATSGCVALSPATIAAIDTGSAGSRQTSPRAGGLSPASVLHAGSESARPAPRRTPCDRGKATTVASTGVGIPLLRSTGSHASQALDRAPRDLPEACVGSGRCAAHRRSHILLPGPRPPDPRRSVTTARRSSHPATHFGTRGCLLWFSPTNRRRALPGCVNLGGRPCLDAPCGRG